MRLISRRRGRVCAAFGALALAALSPLSIAAPSGTPPAQVIGGPKAAVPLDSPGGGVAIDLVGISDLHGYIEVFSPDAFVEGEDDQGCGGDRGDGSGIEGDVLEGLEVLDQGVGPLGGSPH